MDIVKNYKEGFTAQNLKNDALSLLAGPIYTALPTVTGQNGWLGLLIAFGAPYLIGKTFNIQALCHAAVGALSTHLSYEYLAEPLKDMNNKKGMWYFNPANTCSTGVKGLGELPSGTVIRTLPNGEQIAFTPGAQVPDNVEPIGVNDYMTAEEPLFGVNDYMTAEEPLFDNVLTRGGEYAYDDIYENRI